MTPPPTTAPAEDRAISAQIREYLEMIGRRKSWILLVALGIFVAITVVAMRLPNVYRAETVILVDPQKVPENIVPSSVTGNVSDRLSTIRQEVMSPTQLGLLVKDMNLYQETGGKVSEQDLVARMQKSTTIEVVDSGGQRLSAFRIAFMDTNQDAVAPVANRLASLFIARNLNAREQRVQGTSKFLDTELQETKQQLEVKEHTLQEIKSRYIMELPESKQYHLETMNALRDQLRNSQEQVSRDRQSKIYLQTMAGLSAPTIDLDQQGGVAKSPYQAELQKLDVQLRDLLARYGANYPDVKKLRNQIAQLKAKEEAEKPATETPDPQVKVANQQIQNPVVASELNKLDKDIEDQTKIQADLEKQIQYHADKVQQVPVFEQQIAGLMRDYDSLQNHYNQLQAKKLDADMSAALDSNQQGERFERLDPAVRPQGPVGPKRGLMIIGGLLFGLVCGFGVAFLVEVGDESVRTEREAAQIFGKPVLAGIPQITTDQERIRALWQMASLTAGTTVAALAVGFAISRLIS